jgi:hypothetical protein
VWGEAERDKGAAMSDGQTRAQEIVDTHALDGSWPGERWEGAIADPDRLWVEVTQEILGGKSLRVIARERGYPVLRFAAWVTEDGARAQEYERLLALRGDELAHEALAIADATENGVETTTYADGSQQVKESDMLGHRKMKIETRLKLAAKWDRERYGDKLDVKHSGLPPALQIVINSGYTQTQGATIVEQAPALEQVPDQQEDAQDDKPALPHGLI